MRSRRHLAAAVTVAVALVTAVALTSVSAANLGRHDVRAARSCGVLPRTIGIHVSARNMGCREARRLMRALLAGSRACYPHGYTPHPSCTVDGFRCHGSSHGQAAHGRCVKGRRVATGHT